MKNVISQSLGLDPVYINVYTKVYQIIPFSSRDRAIFTFSEFEPRQRLCQSQMIFDDSWATSCQYQCVCKILSNYSNRFKSYRHFSRTGRWHNLHKQAGGKIQCLIIGHTMKVNLQFQLTFLGSCNTERVRVNFWCCMHNWFHVLFQFQSLCWGCMSYEGIYKTWMICC